LAREIKEVIKLSNYQITKLQEKKIRKFPKKWRLFKKHRELIEKRDGPVGKKAGEIAGFFVPRRNFFLGKPLIYAGVYPDGVIRLVKKGKAHFPARSVHEQIQIDGKVSWLFNNLEHHDSPTLRRYLERMNRYTTLTAKKFKQEKIPRNLVFLIYYSSLKPLFIFLKLYIRHKGFLDGMRGFIWSFFSSLHYPISYFKYWQMSVGKASVKL
jgi:hypothetical protein